MPRSTSGQLDRPSRTQRASRHEKKKQIQCPMCSISYSGLKGIKRHLSLISTSNGLPRCRNMSTCVSSDIWENVKDNIKNNEHDEARNKLSQINKVIIATPKKRNKSGPKTSPLNELTPGSKQITRRMKRIIELVLEEYSSLLMSVLLILSVDFFVSIFLC